MSMLSDQHRSERVSVPPFPGDRRQRPVASALRPRTATPVARLYDPQPTILDAGGHVRASTRPAEHRPADYFDRFDATTLFFDAFFDRSRTTAVFIGPPFANLAPLVAGARFTALPSQAECTPQIRTLDRNSQLRLKVPQGTTAVRMQSDLGDFTLTPSGPERGLFAGKRVMLTLSKDNDLAWIADWIRYGRDIHGANAVLIYDNASTRYSAEELLSAVAATKGIDTAVVVRWPFKYGPQGIDEMRCWDSDFCQHGALEHARWKFLGDADGVLNSDVDELVASDAGGSIFAAARRSLTGMVRYPGVWVYGFEGGAPPVRTHTYSEFGHYLRPEYSIRPHAPSGLLNTKWAVVPWRCPARCQWTTHRIYGLRGLYSELSMNRTFRYRHYREVNTNWHYDRSTRAEFDPQRFAPDDVMVENFRKVSWSE